MNGTHASPVDISKLKVALVHDWFVGYFGAERMVEQVLRVFPQANLFALIDFLPDNGRQFIQNKKIKTSFIQKLPRAAKLYRSYLPLMPLAIEQFDMSGYDLIISSNYAVAKGVITGPDQLHVCLCYSPMRYAWDLMHQYLDEAGLSRGVRSWLARIILHRMRLWDYRTAAGVDDFIAISNYIARRIYKVYRRASTVIYPPVDVGKFIVGETRQDHYLTASRLVPYKRVGTIVAAFRQMPDKKLLIIGDGPEFTRIRKNAGPNVTMLGYQSTGNLHRHMMSARAFIFAACEDFGIIPVEAQACGTPVIAYGRGGARETIIEGKTGIFFEEQTPEAIVQAVTRFETMADRFDPHIINSLARRFSVNRFQAEFRHFIKTKVDDYFGTGSKPPAKKLHLRGQSESKAARPGEEILKEI